MNYISATDLVDIYREMDNTNLATPYAMALGASWSLLTDSQKQWLLDFASRQLAEKIG